MSRNNRLQFTSRRGFLQLTSSDRGEYDSALPRLCWPFIGWLPVDASQSRPRRMVALATTGFERLERE